MDVAEDVQDGPDARDRVVQLLVPLAGARAGPVEDALRRPVRDDEVRPGLRRVRDVAGLPDGVEAFLLLGIVGKGIVCKEGRVWRDEGLEAVSSMNDATLGKLDATYLEGNPPLLRGFDV